MIRKLSSGEYRLYSRKKDPQTGKRRNLGTFDTRAAPRSTNAKCSSSSGISSSWPRLPAAVILRSAILLAQRAATVGCIGICDALGL